MPKCPHCQTELTASDRAAILGSVSSQAKRDQARINGAKGGRNKTCAACKVSNRAVQLRGMVYDGNKGIVPVDVPLCPDHAGVGGVMYKGKHCYKR